MLSILSWFPIKARQGGCDPIKGENADTVPGRCLNPVGYFSIKQLLIIINSNIHVLSLIPEWNNF